MRRTVSTTLAIAIGACSFPHALAQQPVKPATMATTTMQAYAPTLGDYTNDVLFGDVWERPGLSKRDRSLVTVAALVTMGRQPQLERHLARALDNGVKPSEISGLVTHLAFYAGWPAASSALDAVDKVFRERGVDTAALRTAPAARLPLPASDGARALIVEQQIAPLSPKLAELTNKVLFDDLWRRSDLSPRDRSLVTVAALVAGGSSDQLSFHIARGVENGLTRAEISEELTHLAFYTGWPKAVAAVAVAAKSFEAVSTGNPVASAGAAASEPLRIYQNDPKPVYRSDVRFTGAIAITGPLALAADSRFRSSIVTFPPGARTYWHSHPFGQLLIVTAGRGWVQAEGQPVRAVGPGDVIWTAPGVRHWHGGTRTSALTHVAVSDADESKPTLWGGPVTDEQYRGPE